jgi:hypothetical protein
VEEEAMSEQRERVPSSFTWAMVAAATLGCGGAGVGDDGTVGTDAGTTDAGETDGGDGPARPPAKGGSHFAVTSGGCNVAVNFPIPIEGQPVNSVYLGARVEDGVDGASVDCRVVTSANGCSFDGILQVDARAFTIIATVAPDDADGYTGSGTVWHTDPNSPALRSDDGACIVTVLPNQDIAPGRVWGNFECPSVSANNDPGVSCSARGSFVFENCEQ